MMNNRSIPSCTVIPVLGYSDVREAVAWLSRVFGFRERLQIADHRSQLMIGDGAIAVAGDDSTPGGHSVMIRIDDLDRHYEQAKREGAVIVREPADHPYGERQYTAQDFAGHVWTFTQSIADVDPADWGGVLK